MVGGVIALLPGFKQVSAALTAIADPLANVDVTVTALAGGTGSASGGMDTVAARRRLITSAKTAAVFSVIASFDITKSLRGV